MPHALRPALLTTTYTHVTRLAAVGLGFGLLGAGMMVALAPTPVAPLPAPVLATPETVTIAFAVPMVVTVEAPPALSLGEVSLVFGAGGASYVKLADLGMGGEPMPRHGKPRLSDDADSYSSVATVADAEIPLAYRGWKGKRVTVDGACTTTVTGFAVVGRLTGDTGYAGTEDEHWNATSVLAHGTPVLAARLAGCPGTYARDASLPPIVVLQQIEDAPLAAAATKAMLSTPAVARAQDEWVEAGRQGRWYADRNVERTTQVLRHPTTGQTFVSIQVRHEGGCGDPDLNVWGLYRADPDGRLLDMAASLGQITTIDKLVDVEGDGQLEVIGRLWFTGTILARATGEELHRIEQQFYGCGC